MPSSQTDKLKNEDENALINVAGDATIEQSKWILDDYHQSDTHVEELKYHLVDESNLSALKKRCVNFDEERARKILEYGFSLLRMSKKETSKVRNILDLSFDDRWRLDIGTQNVLSSSVKTVSRISWNIMRGAQGKLILERERIAVF